MSARWLVFWLDETMDSTQVVIGDSRFETLVSPLVEAGRRLVRLEACRSDGTVIVDVVRNTDGDDEFRVASLASCCELACGATSTGAPMVTFYAEPARATLFATFKSDRDEERVLVGILDDAQLVGGPQ